jgi:hypothetical protein
VAVVLDVNYTCNQVHSQDLHIRCQAGQAVSTGLVDQTCGLLYCHQPGSSSLEELLITTMSAPHLMSACQHCAFERIWLRMARIAQQWCTGICNPTTTTTTMMSAHACNQVHSQHLHILV